ncbi:MAG: hypothetical protein ACRC4M_01165 [Mycoplasma sp.]
MTLLGVLENLKELFERFEDIEAEQIGNEDSETIETAISMTSNSPNIQRIQELVEEKYQAEQKEFEVDEVDEEEFEVDEIDNEGRDLEDIENDIENELTIFHTSIKEVLFLLERKIDLVEQHKEFNFDDIETIKTIVCLNEAIDEEVWKKLEQDYQKIYEKAEKLRNYKKRKNQTMG